MAKRDVNRHAVALGARSLLGTATVGGLAAAMLSLSLVAAPALARREAAPNEKATILADAGGDSCSLVYISTADPNWAAIEGCDLGAPTRVVHRSTGRWAEVEEVFDPSAPCRKNEMPVAVQSDLHLCVVVHFTSRPYVYNFQTRKLVTRPQRLPQGAHGAYRGIRWAVWRPGMAIGYGFFEYADLTEHFRVPVRLTLSGVDSCANGVLLFTRRRVVAVHKQDARRIRFDAAQTAYGSCADDSRAPRVVGAG